MRPVILFCFFCKRRVLLCRVVVLLHIFLLFFRSFVGLDSTIIVRIITFNDRCKLLCRYWWAHSDLHTFEELYRQVELARHFNFKKHFRGCACYPLCHQCVVSVYSALADFPFINSTTDKLTGTSILPIYGRLKSRSITHGFSSMTCLAGSWFPLFFVVTARQSLRASTIPTVVELTRLIVFFSANIFLI